LEAVHGRNIEPYLSELAGHLRGAGAAAGGEKAFEYTLRAARAAEASLAWEEAVRSYEWCRMLLREGSVPIAADEAELLASLGRARTFAGQHDAAIADLRAAAAMFREHGDWSGSARAALLAQRGATPVVDQGELIDLALEAPGRRDARLEALLLLQRADQSGRGVEEARRDVEKAESLVDGGSFPEFEAGLAMHRGLALELEMRWAEAEPFFRQAVDGFMALGDIEQAGRAKLRVAHCFLPEGPLDDVAVALRELAEHGERFGQAFAVEAGWPLLSSILIRRGDLAGAERLLEPLPEASHHTNFWRLWLADLRRDSARALALLPYFERVAPVPLLQLTSNGSRCRVFYNAGELKQASQEFAAWALVARESATENVVHLWNAVCIEQALFEFADSDLLHHLYEGYKPLSRYRTNVMGSMDVFLGNLALALGREGEAEEWYRRGLEWTRQERCVLDEALCLQGLAQVALKRGGRSEARRLLSQAVAIFETYGAKLYLDRAMVLLTVLGGGAQSAEPEYPDSLSEREVDVLRLVAAGKSNQQIADELVISLNTVRRHVSNILVKTNASNRTEAGVYAHRNGLA
jgi:DNA-binding CsgD family transcriptional regulator